MNKFISILFATLIVAGCQGENAKEEGDNNEAKQAQVADKTANTEAKVEKQSTAVEETNTASAEHENHDGHDHAAQSKIASGEKFQEIEPLFECEEPVVIEFFAYHCPHCYNLEPAAEKWRKNNDGKVKFLSIPTTLGHDQLGSMLLVHHAAKKLGVLEKTQHALFERFHKEKKLFSSAEDAADFLAAQGADKAQALATLNDQEYMNQSIGADYDILMKYKISSVPQVLVNHRYLTNITAAGGHDKVFELVDELLAKPHSCGKK